MGIVGLESYLSSRLEQVKVRRGCKLYVDGDGWSHREASKQGCLVNYPNYIKQIRKDFEKLHDSFTVIVFFDGNSGKKKQATTLKRHRFRLGQCRSVATSRDNVDRNKSSTRLYCTGLYKRLMKIELKKLGITTYQCWGEADQEMAYRAEQDGASVLGEDSDFYILSQTYIPMKSFMKSRREGIHKQSLSHKLCCPSQLLPFYAALCENDFSNDKLTRYLRKIEVPVGNHRQLGKYLASKLTGTDRTREGGGRLLADLLSESYAAEFVNSKHAQDRSVPYFCRELLRLYDSFSLNDFVKPTPITSVPSKLVLRFENGVVSSEFAGLVRQNEESRWWQPAVVEVPEFPPVQEHTLPIRRQIYSLILGTDSVNVITRDGGIRLKSSTETFTQTPTWTLNELYSETCTKNRLDYLKYFFQMFPDTLLTSLDLITDVELFKLELIAIVSSQSGVFTQEGMYAFLCGYQLSIYYTEYFPWNNNLRQCNQSIEFLHLINCFLASVQSILLANDVCDEKLLGSEPDMVFFNAEACLVASRWFKAKISTKGTLQANDIYDVLKTERVSDECITSCMSAVQTYDALCKYLDGGHHPVNWLFLRGDFWSLTQSITINEALHSKSSIVMNSTTVSCCEMSLSVSAELVARLAPNKSLVLVQQEYLSVILRESIRYNDRQFLDLTDLGTPISIDPSQLRDQNSTAADSIIIMTYSSFTNSVLDILSSVSCHDALILCFNSEVRREFLDCFPNEWPSTSLWVLTEGEQPQDIHFRTTVKPSRDYQTIVQSNRVVTSEQYKACTYG